jgi:hypothetical protein
MPKGTLLELANEMNTAQLLVKLRARELTKFVALRMLEYLVRVTPVDTSQALSNWRIAVGGTSYGAEPIPAYFQGAGGSTASASAAAAIAAAKEALKGAQPRKALAIINRVPYIQRLNEGSSTQAPAGFIEEAILVGRLAVKEYNFNQRLKQDIRRGKVIPDG